jgi:pimeloyl-ACP methyl ester carboxylesterase
MIARLMFAAAALAITVPAVIQPMPAHAVPAAADRLIQMDHISVQVVGKGPPLILIPGLSTPRAVWDQFVPELAATHTVYLVQVNGFAGEDPRGNLKPGVLAGIVADLHALVVQEKLQGAAVVGHSLGGLAGLMFAKAHPGDLGRLMVVDSLPFLAVLFFPGATVASVEPQAAGMRDQMIASYGQPANQAMAEGTAARLALTPEARAKVVAWTMAADPRVSGRAMYEDLVTDLRGDLAGISTPITLVYPYSQFVPQAQADPLYRGAYAAAPHVSFVVVGDAAHFVMLDQPEAFRTALTAFLK